jgi:hypothetical protein
LLLVRFGHDTPGQIARSPVNFVFGQIVVHGATLS